MESDQRFQFRNEKHEKVQNWEVGVELYYPFQTC
jgi:hypothetical protein